MKLLPYIIPFVKDAARSVKRICQADFKEVVDETLTELLGIATLVVKMYAMRREGEHEVLHLWCAHREEIAMCTHCGAVSTAVHQEEHRCIAIWMYGARRRFCISWLAAFNANTVAGRLPRNCPSWMLIGGTPRPLRDRSSNHALAAHARL